MTSNSSPPSPQDILIFGGTGDLAFRKLLPALYMADLHGRLEPGTRIIGVGRQDLEREAYLDRVRTESRPFIESSALQAGTWGAFLDRLDYVRMNLAQAADYAQLATLCGQTGKKVFYLATAPDLFSQICAHLHGCGLVDPGARVVLEKPLGKDLLTARAINEEVARYFDESQIFRIDHYLGKETVQNLMVLRFGNAIFEPLWRAPYIKSVQITVAETVGVGNRAGFYDETGAMRDMVQNHLLQLLCFVAMEPPISLDPDDVRDEKLKVLRSLRKMDLADVKRCTVRGQYTAGMSEGIAAKSYLEEDNVPDGSHTETFVSLQTHVNNARWANVPFFLRTGKRMQTRQSQIIIEFAEQPFSIFAKDPNRVANRLVIRLQPEESIHLQLVVKEPGSGMSLHPVHLGLDLQSSSTKRRPEAYERLLLDVLKGQLTHFMRRDELEAAWAWVDPILAGWASLGEKPRTYPAGSWGPAASSALMAREGHTWFEEV